MEWLTSASAINIAVLVLSALATADTIRRFVRDRIKRKGYPLPPGPTPLPLLGSALSVNAQAPWLTYTSWQKKYGDVMYARLLDTDMIVLNSRSDATELLEKRSQIYSDRPFIASLEPYGFSTHMAFAPYGPYWKLCRRIIHQTYCAEATLAFRPMQVYRARQIILNIINDPDGYPFHYSTFSAAVAMSAIYDYEPQIREDPMVKIIDDFTKVSVPALIPEKALFLKLFPFLLWIPEWVPVLSWIRRESDKACALSTRMIETPYQWVKKRAEAKEGVMPDTMVFSHIQHMEKLDGQQRAEYETTLKNAASAAFIGSAETTSSAIMIFTLAMVKNPHVWKRAQAEIDSVVGTGRLPEFEDRPSLPYVEAILRETWRWHPVGPIGVPHATTSDDIYKGYYIPSGASVVANIWAMSRDEAHYPNPEAFIPDRFLDSEGNLIADNPTEFIFGFGRRICPGRYSADAAVWSGIATMLATLNFNATKDANGNDIEFKEEFIGGLSRQPVPFPCNLMPRAHITRETIQRYLIK